MKRQRVRKLSLTLAMLLFPVTLYYFSPVLILNAGLRGVINGSFIVFVLLFVLSIPFGRLFCAYLCPGGGLQECAFAINERSPVQGWRNKIKYVIWSVWIVAVTACYLYSGKISGVRFGFETEHGISVTSVQSYIIYYGIVLLIFVPAVLFGKRVFCHYLCWMAPFMVLGEKLRSALKLPGLRVVAKDKSKCISCGKCSRSCPMSLNVMEMTQSRNMNNTECIQCGACIDNCPRKVLGYGLKDIS